MNKLRPATSLSKTIGISVAQISRLLDLEGKNKSPNQICGFWYDVCTKQKWLDAFETVAKNYLNEHVRQLPNEGAASNFFKISTSVIATAQKKPLPHKDRGI